MSRGVALATLALVLLAACVEADDEPPAATPSPAEANGAADSAEPSPTATAGRGPLSDREVIALIEEAVCWSHDPALAASCLPPSTDALEAIAAMGASGDARFVAPLIDMRWLDLGWDQAIEDALLAITGARLDDPHAWYQFEHDGPITPGYAAWKAGLLALTATEATSSGFVELLGSFEDAAVLRQLVWTGVQPNGRPPLDAPGVVHRQAASYLGAGDVVYGLVVEGEARAYPRRIVAWHGAVNDVIGETPVLLSHCLPCGGAVAFDRTVEGDALTFGNAGLALLGRTLLFEEGSLALWDAFAGAPLGTGERAHLEALPLVTTTWGAWSAAHPETGVLSIDTGHDRDYTAGAAVALEAALTTPLYPAPPAGTSRDAKEPVLGIEVGGTRRAYPVADIEARGVVHDLVAGRALVLLSEGPGQGVRVYASGDALFDRVVSEDGVLVAVDTTGERWFVQERALVSTLDGRERPRVVARQGYWFVWSGIHPDTSVWDGGS